eukprot:366664-Rhodomonas_salina.1
MLAVVRDHAVLHAAPNQPLGVKDGVGGVASSLCLGRLPNQALAFGEGDDGRGRARAFRVGENLCALLAIEPHSDAGVRCAQINADDAIEILLEACSHAQPLDTRCCLVYFRHLAEGGARQLHV